MLNEHSRERRWGVEGTPWSPVAEAGFANPTRNLLPADGADPSTSPSTLVFMAFRYPSLHDMHNARRQPRRRHGDTVASKAVRAADGCTP